MKNLSKVLNIHIQTAQGLVLQTVLDFTDEQFDDLQIDLLTDPPKTLLFDLPGDVKLLVPFGSVAFFTHG